MKDFKDAILYIKTVNKTLQFEKEQLLCAFKLIFSHGMKDGLGDDSLKVLIHMLTKTNLPLACFENLVKCLIPRTSIPECVTTDIILWILSKEPDVTPAKITLVLRWCTGIFNNGLMNTQKFENAYELFFNMIRKPGIEPQACSFVQCITKRHHITRRHVLMLTALQQKGKKSHFDSLLGVLKHMKPNLVPDGVVDCHQPIWSTLEICEPGFQLAKERLQGNSAGCMEVVSHPSLHHDKVYPAQNIIPQIIYSDLCCNHSNVYKLTDIDRWESLGACSVDLEMPIQAMSLLRCSFGVFTLAFGGPDIQRRFSLNLQNVLHSVFLNVESEFSSWRPDVRSRSEANLLHQLSTLQEYLHQPIPVISSFLSKYLPLWDGDTHRILILRLLSYVNFYSFEELESCILDPLNLLFITKDVQFKCNIVNMLKEFMKNLILKDSWRKGKESLFLGVKRFWKAGDVYPKLFEFISDLIETGLSSENGNSFLLFSVLSYYHTMVSLHKDTQIDYLVTPPPSVMYHSLFSYNPVCLSIACSLLVRYKTEIYPLLKETDEMKETLQNLTVYVTDYVNFLCTANPLLNKGSGYIMKNLKDATAKALKEMTNDKPTTTICNHIAFIPFYHIYSETNTPVSDEVLLRTIEKRLPGMAAFLKAFGPRIT